jgi:molecular chaperone GrpE
MMSEEANKEVEPRGKPREGHEAGEALTDPEAAHTAEEARPGEEIAGDDSLSPKQKAKRLRKLSDEELIALAEEASRADHWLDVARRAQAELDNTVKRLKREHSDDLKYAAAGLVRDLLPIIDNLGRALQAGGKTEDFKALHEGVSLTSKMFNEALARHGITPIAAEGKPFDPAVHEALMTTSNPELENDVVAMELEQGWKMLDRVLRASKVQVNKR